MNLIHMIVTCDLERIGFKPWCVPYLSISNAGQSIEVSLHRPFPAGVQGNAMKPATQHFGVPDFVRNHIQPMFLQHFDQSCLVLIDHDQVRIDAEQIHINPLATNAFG